jgi:helix-turn-helix protein
MPEIGETLREARMRAKIAVYEVEAEEKIHAKYLRALENEDWALMPGSTFVRSFLRTYAEYLGLDAKMLVEEYKLRHEALSELDMAPITPPGAQSRQLQPPRISRGWVVGLSVAGLLVLLVVLGSIGGGQHNDKAGVASQRTDTAKSTTKPVVALPAPTTVRLQLVPLDEVYVCLVDARGRRLIDGQILGPNQTPTYNGKKFELLFGHGPEQMKVNGRRQSVPASSDPIGYGVTPTGRRKLSRARLPNCTQ